MVTEPNTEVTFRDQEELSLHGVTLRVIVLVVARPATTFESVMVVSTE